MVIEPDRIAVCAALDQVPVKLKRAKDGFSVSKAFSDAKDTIAKCGSTLQK